VAEAAGTSEGRMKPLPPDLVETAERLITSSANLDFHRKVEAAARALRDERKRCAGEVKALAKRLRRGEGGR
jgi:hypothetical protein